MVYVGKVIHLEIKIMANLYQFLWDCGNQGYLEGLFVADEKDVKDIIGKRIYFGEVLGKHSEVYGDIAEDEITLKSDDQEFVAKLREVIGNNTISGYNPFDYLNDEDEDED